MILACELDRTEGTVIGLDIGTNTEVVLARRGRLRAARPCLGRHLRAHTSSTDARADGAIEKVSIDGDGVQVSRLHRAPIGIRGSGVLDAIDELRRAGLLGRRGRLLPDARGRQAAGGRQFVLVRANEAGTGRDITLSEQDVSEILLAKAAIRTGMIHYCVGWRVGGRIGSCL